MNSPGAGADKGYFVAEIGVEEVPGNELEKELMYGR